MNFNDWYDKNYDELNERGARSKPEYIFSEAAWYAAAKQTAKDIGTRFGRHIFKEGFNKLTTVEDYIKKQKDKESIRKATAMDIVEMLERQISKHCEGPHDSLTWEYINIESIEKIKEKYNLED